MELESINSGPTAKLPILKLESLDSIFNRLQKIVSRLAILGVVIAQEDLNSKFLSSLPHKWNTHVVVWMNKSEVETMSIDDLYNNFKIVEQKVNKSVGGRITGKGTLKNDNLDFEDVYFVNELKFNLFSVSQMCDKKNYVLFTDTECLVLSPNFKLPDENQILLKIPRNDNMYSFDMKNIVPKESLTCLVSNATLDESMLWHIILGKQHRASCKSKVLNPITKPLFMLLMDLFGPTFVSSLMHKKYCLVVTDDYGFTWIFFLTTKDETSEILENFIKEIENLVDLKVKIIRSDNGTEFKNKVMDDFCREKGIKREYSVARTPQQNGVAERRNRTLIEVARIMLADSNLPTTFWAEAVSTACYVQNRVLVVKPHNKTPYELFRGFKPALSFMRPFGCHVTILNTLDSLGKFDGKGDEGFFVGYSLSSKAFRVYNTGTNGEKKKTFCCTQSTRKEKQTSY
ncbi:putative ribonuclease H-like domain-containing protein [Tanacetum coccineum]|uniref:Ribonuclease H-like domain-containing protein n=1 Tax=Tanacetum coccineum TaxID=301880 RepID=A0ABQ5J6R8_9ASTR